MTDLRQYDNALYGNPQTSPNPKVSVCFITYNHAPYIRMALDSIVSQKTTFDFELVIGDDCSTDGTTEIVKEYADNYPHLIRAYIHPVNLTNFGLPGKLNFVHGFSVCKGDYIVHIEGDDYFVDDLKLQKQADFLDKNQHYSACFHNAWMKFEDNSGREDYLINPKDQKKEIVPADLLFEKEIWFMATASVMFRKKIIGDAFPEWFLKTKSGDIPLYVMLSDVAPIAYLEDVMCAYRRHLSGLSYTDSNYDLDFIENRILMYNSIDIHTKRHYHEAIRRIIGNYYFMALNTRQLTHSQKLKLRYFLKSVKFNLPNKPIKEVISHLLTPYNKERLRKIKNKF